MKKLLAILGVITCMIGLCACGQEDAPNGVFDEVQLMAYSESLVEGIHETVIQGMVEQSAVDDVIYNGILGWRNALEDIGEFQGTNGGTVTVNKDETVVDINVLGSKHDAVVEFVVDNTTGAFTSIATNVTYTFGETMEKAVMNTLIGMGTVFVVLIFISLIISCFGLINKTNTKKPASTETAKPASAPAPDPVVSQIQEREELADDTELVAVIAAAIAAYEGSGSTDGFVVRSIRKSNKSKWQNA